MAEQVAERSIQMSEVAAQEVGHKEPECKDWLQKTGLQIIHVNEAILQEALHIKRLLEIEEDKYGSGVDENDLIIIATAKLHGCELVTDEGFQAVRPKVKRNYKIPAVCVMDTVDVSWISFIHCLKRSGKIFG
jgi:predicted nucleic acid-binding protein